jgi:hypothetical protein
MAERGEEAPPADVPFPVRGGQCRDPWDDDPVTAVHAQVAEEARRRRALVQAVRCTLRQERRQAALARLRHARAVRAAQGTAP